MWSPEMGPVLENCLRLKVHIKLHIYNKLVKYAKTDCSNLLGKL